MLGGVSLILSVEGNKLELGDKVTSYGGGSTFLTSLRNDKDQTIGHYNNEQSLSRLLYRNLVTKPIILTSPL